MTMFFLQALVFIAVAFGLGCLFGCWLKAKLGTQSRHPSAAVTHEGVAKAMTAGELAAPRPHYEPETAAQPASADADPETAALSEQVKAEPAPAAKPKTPAKAKPAGKKSASASKSAASGAKPAAKSAAPKAAKPKAAKPAATKAKAANAKPAAAKAPDNLKQIKGIGPTIEAKLNAAGVNSFAQIAAWTKKEQADFAEQLSFSGRIEREEWVKQAKVLAKGGKTEFSKRVAKGQVASSAGKK